MPSDTTEFLPCGLCSNGCTLTLDYAHENEVLIAGHKCQKGLKKAIHFIRSQTPEKTPVEKDPTPQFSQGYLVELAQNWALEKAKVLPNRFIQGSPERSLFRTLIQSGSDLYLLESLGQSSASQSLRIQSALETLREQGHPVLFPLRTTAGEPILQTGSETWRLSPWISHLELDRNTFWKNSEMGQQLGQILNALPSVKVSQDQNFDLASYIRNLVASLRVDHPLAHRGLQPVLEWVNREMDATLERLPKVFNHRDPHPLNCLWKGQKLFALIDWEFASTAPLFYDAALAMGCVGSESPGALMGGFNWGLLQELTHPMFREFAQYLPAMILLLRFPWLGEAARHRDNEWLQSEVKYLLKIFENLESLSQWLEISWPCSRA